MTNEGPRERLYALIDRFERGGVEVGVFCAEFERIYNFELKHGELLPHEKTVLTALLKKVAYYSPIAEERARIVNYLGEDDIREAVRRAMSDLRFNENAAN